MSAGQLRNLVTIEQAITVADSRGDRTQKSWVEFARVWAGFLFSKGTESSEERDSTQGKVIIKCRYIAGVNPKMRVVRDAEVYDIEDVFNKDDRDRYLTMICVRSNK